MTTTPAQAEEDIEVQAEAEEKDDRNNESSGRNNSSRRFPDPFYDPLTGLLMKDPVVNPAGDSYEKSGTTADAATTYYPNRALKAIIEREIELGADGFLGNVRRMDESVRSGLGRLLEKSAFNIEHRPLPESFYCPITCDLIVDPVITPDGYSYERDAIEQWIRANGTSPQTRRSLTVADLRENNALYELIQLEKKKTIGTQHPSIRRWQEAGATSRRPQGHPAPSAPAEPAAEGTAAPAVTQTYPTTHEEIRARQLRNARARQSCVFLIGFTMIAIIMAPGYLLCLAVLVFLAFAVSTCYVAQQANNENAQQQSG